MPSSAYPCAIGSSVKLNGPDVALIPPSFIFLLGAPSTPVSFMDTAPAPAPALPAVFVDCVAVGAAVGSAPAEAGAFGFKSMDLASGI